MKFVLGGSAGMIATSTVQPLDLVKTRMQMSGEGGSTKAYNGTMQFIRGIVRTEGFFKLYAGYVNCLGLSQLLSSSQCLIPFSDCTFGVALFGQLFYR
ncbi:hypothetical protein SprV_0702452100 [Sparganum proliferum]